jgi:hypothetical protein
MHLGQYIYFFIDKIKSIGYHTLSSFLSKRCVMQRTKGILRRITMRRILFALTLLVASAVVGCTPTVQQSGSKNLSYVGTSPIEVSFGQLEPTIITIKIEDLKITTGDMESWLPVLATDTSLPAGWSLSVRSSSKLIATIKESATSILAFEALGVGRGVNNATKGYFIIDLSYRDPAAPSGVLSRVDSTLKIPFVIS